MLLSQLYTISNMSTLRFWSNDNLHTVPVGLNASATQSIIVDDDCDSCVLLRMTSRASFKSKVSDPGRGQLLSFTCAICDSDIMVQLTCVNHLLVSLPSRSKSRRMSFLSPKNRSSNSLSPSYGDPT